MSREKAAPSKRIGSTTRAEKAREDLKYILTDENHPLYFYKDIEFARKYNVTRHTIYHIREELGAPSRSERILKKLKSIDLKEHTMRDLSKMLGIKYQNLYKIILENRLTAKPDTPPIVHLKKYQISMKGKKKKPRKQ